MGVMSAKLFSAMVGGMNANLADFNSVKDIGVGFKEVFSNKDLEGEDNNYPYSQDYFIKMKDQARDILKGAWTDAVNKISGVELGGSSGSEAVRQARMNAGHMAENPNKVTLENNDEKVTIR